MLSFRKKLLLSDIILFLVFIALLFPFVDKTVENIMRKSLDSRAQRLIGHLKKAPDLLSMVQIMETESEFIFQRVVLLDGNGNVLYDTISRYLPQSQTRMEGETMAEVQEAMQKGRGYHESYSPVFQERYAYVALAFDANGQKYILRTGFPYSETHALTIDFIVGFLLLGFFILLLYSVMTWMIVNRLTRPIQQIIDAILPYQEGREEFLPRMDLNKIPSDEFGKLAFTLNSLTNRIQKQIENLKRQKKETEGILESLGEGIVATDTRAKVTFTNQAACKMLGIAHGEILGERLDLVPAKSSDICLKGNEMVAAVLQTAELYRETLVLEGKIYLDLISAPLAHQAGALLLIQDKTSDHKIVEMGKDFIANASHELRTPITIIRGFAETLQDLPELSKEMLREITEKIVRTCGRLDKLVRSLLTLSDIENLSEERFSAVNMIPLVENCRHFVLAAHPGALISIQTELEKVKVKADGDLLDLAITNLLENAIKYSQAPAEIRIQIRTEGDEVFVSVTDKGIGISEADIPLIFGRFYTVDKARSRKSGGAGLGLSIVKTIVEKHQGKIQVSSELGKGSTFTLIFPIYK
jgi:signal transduction histidine kinase